VLARFDGGRPIRLVGVRVVLEDPRGDSPGAVADDGGQ
jgi:hypothetical protein